MARHIAVRVLAIAAAAALAASAAAIDKEWNFPGPADWATDEYWTSWGMPGPFDIAKVDMGTPTVNTLGEYACDALYLGSTVGGAGQWRLEQGVFRANAEYIGYEAGSFCWAWQIGGSNLVTGTFAIGNAATSWGHYYMGTEAVALQAAAIFVGAGGTASLNQNAGAVTTGMLHIAAAPGSEGTYWLGGGTLDTSGGIVSAGNSLLIMAGGTLNTYGSAITLTNFWLGEDNRPGSHTLSGDATIGTERIGRGGTGTVTQNTGTHRVTGLLTLGIEAEGNGTLNLGGGNLDTATVTLGTAGTGRIVHSAGRHSVSAALDIGNGAGFGTYELSGTGILDAAAIRVGNGGTGTFNQTGGTVTFLGDIYISAVPGGWGGTYNLGGTGELYAPNVYVGYASSGWFNQTGGTADLQTKLHVGYGGGSQGIYRMEGGTLAVPEIQVGNGLSATGRFEWFGGTVDTPLLHLDNGTLDMGFNFNMADLMSGDILLSGGTITGLALAQNQLGVSNGATATHSGTTSATVGRLTVGFWNGVYNLSDNATLAVNSLVLGWGGTGTFNQTGGTATVAVILHVGMSGDGEYNLSDGSLIANAVNIGSGDDGVFNQSGGVHTVTTELRLGNASENPGSGTYNLTGGRLAADTEMLGSGSTGTFSQTGGTNTVANLWVGHSYAGTYTLADTSVLAAVNETVAAYAAGTFTQTGGTHTVTGTLAISPSGQSGLVALEGGRLTAATVNLSAGGTFRQTGGTFSAATFNQLGGTVEGSLENRGTFNYTGGTFTGRLINMGTANFAADFEAGDGMENYTSLTVPLGRTFSFGGLGLLNAGTLTLDGGVLSGPGPVTNDFGGAMAGKGTINTDFFNNGTLGLAGLLSVGGAAANAGAIAINATQNLRVAGDFTNTGSVTLNRGALTAATLSNGFGGILEGAGGVTAAVTNSGGLIHASGPTPLVISSLAGGNTGGGEIWVDNAATLSVGTPFANSGMILLKGDAATLSSEAITNSGTIRGKGRLAGTVANSGILRAEGGQLTVAGAGATNAAAGRIEIPADTTVFFTQGLAANGGSVVLTGGTLDNNNQPLVNAGSITGRGTLRTGGLTNNSGKTVGVGGGNMDVFGTVHNDGPWTVQAGYTSTFYDSVSGSGSFPDPGTVVFLGGYSPGGSPAQIGFGGNLVLAAGAILMELGGRTPGGQYDVLDVAGDLGLGGTLDVALIYGFVPHAGDAFDLFDWGGVAGEFEAVNLPALGGGLAWDASNLYSTGTVSVVPEPAALALLALGAMALLRRRSPARVRR